MKHRGIKWTIEEVEELKTLYKQGLLVEEISKKIERSESAIQKKLKEFGEQNRKINWTDEDLQKLKDLFEKGLTYPEIAKELGKTTRACQSKSIRLGLKKKECNVWINNKRSDFWTLEEIENLKSLIEQNFFAKEISEKMNRSIKSIFSKMKELNLHIKEKSSEEMSNRMRVYSVDDNYFEKIDSQKKAYWLGWIITDGYVVERLNTQRGIITSNRMGLKIQKGDSCVLDDFSKDLNSTFPLKDISKKKDSILKNKITGAETVIRAGEQRCLEITSAKIVSDLKKYGIHQNKTYDVKFPENIDKQFYAGLIAGLISGDGSVNLKNNHNKTILIRSNLVGTLDLLEGVKKVLIENIGFNPDKKIMKVKSSKELYNLELCQTETLNLQKWFKENNISLMKRKNDIIEDFIKQL